jgi:Uma2 family endonuclease
MPMLIADTDQELRIKHQRAASGADRFDEVWDGVYVMSPLADPEHQEIVTQLAAILQLVAGWPAQGTVLAGVNVSDRAVGWEKNYRIPDVALFSRDSRARKQEKHYVGGPDLAIEITSPGDLTRDKIPFYATIGTRELLILDRDAWTLERYQLDASTLSLVQKATVDSAESLVSDVVPLQFRLIVGDDRPRIEVRRTNAADRWTI